MIKTNPSFNILRLSLVISLAISVFLILINTNKIIDYTRSEERKKIELWASAQKNFIENKNLDDDIGELTLMILTESFENPIIQVDANGKILSHKNIFENNIIEIDSIKLKNVLEKISIENDPILIKYSNSINQKLYYGNSPILYKIKFYPFGLLIVGLLFSITLFIYYKSSITSNQNKIWASFAKETAHQIGTPLSSLMGWSTILKDEKIDSDIIAEIEKDIERLNKITKRFSEIGSVPKLSKENVNETLNNFIKYLKKRNSSLIELKFNPCNEVIYFRINKTLFEWVIENLIKNAIDSMNGKGMIEINVLKTNRNIQVEIKDSGKGILKENYNKIFNPGFSLKKKGWGLGLSLSKRIINLYHGGNIYVKDSKINSGSTLVISLPLIIESS